MRGRLLSYSLVKEFVASRRLVVVYLPEAYDELSRRLLFQVERKIPLTDLRVAMLSAYLGLPLLTLTDEFLARLQEEVKAQVLHQLKGDPNAVGKMVKTYRGLLREARGLSRGGKTFEDLAEKAGNELNSGLDTPEANPGSLDFKFVAWDLTPVLHQYAEDRVVDPWTLQSLWGSLFLLVVKPSAQIA